MLQSTHSANKKLIILALTTLTLFAVAYFPVFQILVGKWANAEEYTHAFITVPIIIYMVWCKKNILVNSRGGNTLVGLPLIVLSILLYLVSLQLQIPTVCSVAMVLTLLSVLIYLTGFGTIKVLATPIILLIIIIPIPNQVYSMVTLPLQLKVSQVCEIIIQLVNIPVLREGNIIHTPEKTFQIVEACSGLRSMITLITLSLIMGYFLLTRTLSKVLLLVLSIPVAFFVNVIRVVVLVLAFHYFKVDLADGTKHTLLGILIFGIAMVTMLFLQRILEKWEIKELNS